MNVADGRYCNEKDAEASPRIDSSGMVPPDKAPAVTTPTKNIQVPCGSLAVHWRGYTSCLPTEKGVPRGTAVARGRNDARLVTLPSAVPPLVTNWIEPLGLSNPT